MSFNSARTTIYNVVSGISYFIRSQYLPNPFESIIQSYATYKGIGYLGQSFDYMFNLLVGSTLLFFISFVVVGTIYQRGENPALGSFLFLLIFWINTLALIILGSIGSVFIFQINLVINIIGMVVVIALEIAGLMYVFG